MTASLRMPPQRGRPVALGTNVSPLMANGYAAAGSCDVPLTMIQSPGRSSMENDATAISPRRGTTPHDDGGAREVAALVVAADAHERLDRVAAGREGQRAVELHAAVAQPRADLREIEDHLLVQPVAHEAFLVEGVDVHLRGGAL